MKKEAVTQPDNKITGVKETIDSNRNLTLRKYDNNTKTTGMEKSSLNFFYCID